jgi:hypothetical protein
VELGFQVGFPWSLGVGINFSYSTPTSCSTTPTSTRCPPGSTRSARSSPEPVPGVSIGARDALHMVHPARMVLSVHPAVSRRRITPERQLTNASHIGVEAV